MYFVWTPIYWLWSYWYCLSHPIGRITDVDGDHIWKWTLTFKPFSRISSALAPRTVQCTAIFSLRRMPNERTVYRAIRESNNKVSIMHNPSQFHFKVFHDLLTNKFIICPDIVRCQATNLTWLNITFIFFLHYSFYFFPFQYKNTNIYEWKWKGRDGSISWSLHDQIWVWYNCTFFGTFWQYIRRVWSCQWVLWCNYVCKIWTMAWPYLPGMPLKCTLNVWLGICMICVAWTRIYLFICLFIQPHHNMFG